MSASVTPQQQIEHLFAAFAGGDVPTVLGTLAANVTWIEAEGFPYGGTYVGPQAVLQGVFMRLGTEWEGFQAVPNEYVVRDDTVVALGEYSGTFKATGKRIRVPFVHVWKFAGGKIRHFRQHTDTAVVQRALS